jgi:diaminopimelate epimerase
VKLSFEKYSGCGNDFILIDNRSLQFPISQSLIQQLCHRKQGIGADGLILLENAEFAHARMRIFNSDGSEAEMCGNGLRCFAKWLIALGYSSSPLKIQVMNRTLQTWQKGEEIGIEMAIDENIEWDISIAYEDQLLTLHYLNTGVPHVILFGTDIQRVDLMNLGPFLRHHLRWNPKGTNVTLAQAIDQQTYRVRTFERGVEGETLACGTGATAAALAAAHLFDISSPITIETLSKERLTVNYERQNGCFKQVTLIGPVRFLFKGEFICE